MKLIQIAGLVLLLGACTALPAPQPEAEDHPILAGRQFYVDFICSTVGQARLWAEGVAQSQKISRAATGLLMAGVCVRIRAPGIVTVDHWIETITDWEGDDAYIVQYRSQRTGQAGDFYGITWLENEVGEES